MWHSTQVQKRVDRSVESQRMEATGMLQGTDLQEEAIKLSIVCVILANRARGGQKESGGWSGRVTEPPSISQQGGIS